MIDTVKCRRMARTLGYRVAAGYLRNRGVSLEEALNFFFPEKYGRSAA